MNWKIIRKTKNFNQSLLHFIRSEPIRDNISSSLVKYIQLLNTYIILDVTKLIKQSRLNNIFFFTITILVQI